MRKYKIRPFVAFSIGSTSFKTKLVVRNPEEYTQEYPKPLTENLFESQTSQKSATLDLRFVLHKIAIDEGTPRTNFVCLDIGITHLMGEGEARYMVLKNDMPNPNAGSEVVIPFASQARPDIVHLYNAGRIYSNPLDLLLVQVGSSFRIQRPPQKYSNND